MIKKIHIENFKSIKSQTVELKPINILVGQNGAGKSNFLSLFEFLKSISDFNKSLEKYFFFQNGIDKVLFKNQANNLNIDVFGDDTKYSIKLLKNNYNKFIVEKETVSNDFTNKELDISHKVSPNQNYSGFKGFFNSSANYNDIKDYSRALSMMKSFQMYYYNEKEISKAQEKKGLYFLYDDISNLWPHLHQMSIKFKSNFENIISVLKLVFPTFKQLEFISSENGKDLLDIVWHEEGFEKGFDPSQLSNGTKRFIVLATILLMPSIDEFNVSGNPDVIIIDEPEIGLHPYAIHVLAELIHKASNHKQVIIATQSVELINNFKPNDLIIAEKITRSNPYGYEIGETIFTRPDDEKYEEWLEDYKTGQLFEAGNFGFAFQPPKSIK